MNEKLNIFLAQLASLHVKWSGAEARRREPSPGHSSIELVHRAHVRQDPALTLGNRAFSPAGQSPLSRALSISKPGDLLTSMSLPSRLALHRAAVETSHYQRPLTQLKPLSIPLAPPRGWRLHGCHCPSQSRVSLQCPRNPSSKSTTKQHSVIKYVGNATSHTAPFKRPGIHCSVKVLGYSAANTIV